MVQTKQLTGEDLEEWRLAHDLTKLEASIAFGMHEYGWIKLTKPEVQSKSLKDSATAMLLELYNEHPELAPVHKNPDIKDFYEFLQLKDSAKDRELFAKLIGRSPSSVCRLLMHDGEPSKPVIVWIQALQKLKLSPKKTLQLMKNIAGV